MCMGFDLWAYLKQCWRGNAVHAGELRGWQQLPLSQRLCVKVHGYRRALQDSSQESVHLLQTNLIQVETAAEWGHEPEKGRFSTSVSNMHRTLLMWMSKTHWLCCEKLLEQGIDLEGIHANNAALDRTCEGQVCTHTIVKIPYTFLALNGGSTAVGISLSTCMQHGHTSTQSQQANALMCACSHPSVPCHYLAHCRVSEEVSPSNPAP